MHYALNLRTFVHSHYFYFGLRVAIGVLGLTFIARELAGTAVAMTVCIGALCTSLMDMPSPLRHKINELMASALLCTLITLIIVLCGALPGPFKLLLVALVSFLASMMVVYGKKSMPLQLAALFSMTMALEHDMTVRQSFAHSALFLAGALCYIVYAMVVAWFLRHRIKQQVLAEALFELAHYVDIKADFYDTRYNLSEQFNALVRHQSLLADRQQASRDLILRGRRNRRDAIVIQVHVCMLDLYEMILSTHTDYALLRTHLADTEALSALQRIAVKAARDIETVAYAVTRKRASSAIISYEPEMATIDAELQTLQQRAAAGAATHEAQAVLRAQRNKLQAIIAKIGQLHRATQQEWDSNAVWEGVDMDPFLSQQRYSPSLMLSNMRLDAPVFRFALRLALAISAGMLIGPHLPYAAHSYWIVLTLVFILRPSYAITKQRRIDRVAGTLIGCFLTALTLYFITSTVLILAVVFLAMVAAPAFIQLRYRYSSVAVSMLILLQLHLIAPGTSHLISERLIDTAVGALLAGVFSFVLASWEYQGLGHLMRQVLQANISYMEASFRLLQGLCKDDVRYRIARKCLMDNLASLSGALVRMLDEPAGKQRAVEDVNQFIVQNYLLVAHVAALRALLQRHEDHLPTPAVNALLQASHARICRTLALALQQSGGTDPAAGLATDAAVQAADEHRFDPLATTWQGWPLLERRIALLQADADRISVHGSAIRQSIAAIGT
jgi:uncharacterized membrane protein YccC